MNMIPDTLARIKGASQLNKWRHVHHFFLEEQLFVVNIYQYEKFTRAIAW